MKNLKRIFLPTLLVLLLAGCDHETDFFDGPSLVDRFGEFTLVESLEVSSPTVDFSAGENVFFTALFNKRVNFSIVITGSESGAIKVIEGFDSEVNAANATWQGGTTELPFFREEICEVELIIPEEDSLTLTGMVEIIGTKEYEGTVFADFEEDPGTDIEFVNPEFEFTNATARTNDGQAAQGEWYYYLEGTDDVVPNFFVGLVAINSSINGETYATLPTTAPEELYFNMFLLADGGPHGIAVIQFVTDSNDSGAYEDGPDQTFQLEGDFPLDWVGWRQFSHTMADVGMTQEQLEKLVAIRVLLISDMNSQPNPPLPVDFGIDFMTFTANTPLEL